MTLIEHLKGMLFFHVEVQPEGTYFSHMLPEEDLCKLDRIIGAFQPGDAALLEQLLQENELRIQRHDPQAEAKFILGDTQKMLRRLAEAARLMEADDHASD